MFILQEKFSHRILKSYRSYVKILSEFKYMYFNSGRNILWDFFLIRKESFSDNNQFDIFVLVINPRDRLDASIIKVVQTLPAIIYLVYNLTFFWKLHRIELPLLPLAQSYNDLSDELYFYSTASI